MSLQQQRFLKQVYTVLDKIIDNTFELYVWLTFVVIASYLFNNIHNETQAQLVYICVHVFISFIYYFLGYVLFLAIKNGYLQLEDLFTTQRPNYH